MVAVMSLSSMAIEYRRLDGLSTPYWQFFLAWAAISCCFLEAFSMALFTEPLPSQAWWYARILEYLAHHIPARNHPRSPTP